MERQRDADSLPGRGARTIAIAATFTADPLQQPLKFWMEKLDLAADVRMAPYAQVLQELLAPRSLLSQNQNGFNILLVRLDDWIRDRHEQSVDCNVAHIRAVAADFSTALGTLRSRSSAAILVVLCPSSAALPAAYVRVMDEVRGELVERMDGLAQVHCWTHADISRLYPSEVQEDLRSDRIGHIPYTGEYFAALATMLARRIAALLKPAYKVIAIDCDNTLWKGICGEDGAAGIELTPSHLLFQEMLVRQHDAGVLLCLCSKNNPGDVEAVFRSRPEMSLREAHLVCSRVNWEAKSSNLQSIANELSLSLDSFVFVDDSPLECAEVRANCPAVLSLQFPGAPAEIAHFMNHVWAFDRIGVTDDAKLRTSQYKENRARSHALEEVGDLRTFLESLELQVDVAPVQPAQLARVAELVQRTSQFNLTAVWRSLSDVEALWSSGQIQILAVRVRDRFGDYGLVGALFVRREPRALSVDTFVLSCRVLGRGVEHRIVNELARMARQEGLSTLVLRYRQTQRNVPAGAFLNSSFAQFLASTDDSASGDDSVYVVPVEYAETRFDIEAAAAPAEHDAGLSSGMSTNAGRAPSATQWHESAYRLSRVADLVREIDQATPRGSRGSSRYIAPRTPAETAVAEIWADIFRVEAVGVRDNFLELGGDSLLAVQAIARMDSVLGLELPLHAFFEGPTVEEVAARLAGAARSSAPIQRLNRTGPLPLSWAQQRLWFIDQLEGSAAYHVPVAVRLRGELRRPALQAALDALLARHEALRTVFVKADDETAQEIALPAPFALEFVDLTALSEQQREAEVLEQEHEELSAPFDLSTGPVIRGRLLMLAQEDHVLLVTMHHIASDGWSIGVLVRELGTLYDAYRDGRSNPLSPLAIQYSDYAQWQRQWLAESRLREQLAYWEEHLRGAPQLLELPVDRPRPAVQSYSGSNVAVSLGADLTADLQAFSRKHNLTLAMSLYAAWSIVLSRLGGQEDIVVGMPIANRRRTELEGLIGFFVNTLAVRVRLQDDPTLADLLQQVKASMLGAYAHSDVPFEQVVEAVQPARSLSRSPIFQVIFALQNAPREPMQLLGLTLEEREVPQHTAQFDLSLSLQETAAGIRGTLNYATDLFERATVERWVGYFKAVLGAMVLDSQLPISRVSLMGETERRQVLELFNATQRDLPPQKLIHQLFEEQAEQAPEAIALVCGDQRVTYVKLNRRANQLAHLLVECGVRPDDRVGLYVERSVEMIVGLLAILKAGGAYVPLDPSYPAERLSYMLRDSAPVVLLTQNSLLATAPETDARVIQLDTHSEEIGRRPDRNLDSAELGIEPRHLAYVIYTSGSTGTPKGVAVEHRNLENVVYWHCAEFDVRAGVRCSCVAAIGFDAATWEIWMPLSAGATLVLASAAVSRDVDTLLAWWASEPLNVSFLPTPMAEFVFSGNLRNPTLRTLLTGGDRLHLHPPSESFAVVNNYGPTETTVLATSGRVSGADATLHIGRPIANTQVYILDRHGQPTPISVGGEIFIGGAGVARGYLNLPEQQAQRFVADPFSAKADARMYRTGDLARWRADGTIEFLGRNDEQVKIRGYRIELGEIETQLAGHELVRQVVVIAREDVPGDRYLAAYITRHQDGSEVDPLRSHLKATLPEYMIPRAFVTLKNFPLTANGKIDRRALPMPEIHAPASRPYAAPQGELEQAVALIWRELLNVKLVGRDDDFFELGGHSLLAMRLVGRIRSSLSMDISMRMLFEFPTLKELAAALDDSSEADWLASIENGSEGLDELLERVAAMPESEVEELMGELRQEAGS